MTTRKRNFTFRPRSSLFPPEGKDSAASSEEILPLRRVKLDRQTSSVTRSACSFGCAALAIVFTLAFLQYSDKSIHRAFFAGSGASSGVPQQYDAVIVGAGWAGISAAKELLEDGVENILVLEAHDYIGGR